MEEWRKLYLVKKLLALLLLFGIVGCTAPSTLIGVTPDGVDDKSWIEWKNLSNGMGGALTYDFKNNGQVSSKVFYKVDKASNKIYFKAKGSPFYGVKTYSSCPYKMAMMNTELPKLCQYYFGGSVKLFPEFEEAPLKCNWGMLPPTIMLVTKNENFSVECFTPEEAQKQIVIAQKQREDADKYHLEQIALLKVKALEVKKSKCRTYGFKDDTDGMGLCLIELDKLDAIKNQATAANLAQSNLIAQQQAEAKKQRQSQALINLGAMIGGAGVPSTTRPKPVTPSYSNSYSSSRTVPSNQNCPLLNVPLKKQEVKGGNRICYY